MFDGLLDLLDRDRSRSNAGTSPRRGLRGIIDRLSGGDDDDHDHRARRYDDGDDDESARTHRSTRRRERDESDWDD